ncbi:MAG: Gfo/Idh/MocA family oxidoreductase [Candidatus Lernaella stagnicola]|nr:Gfo/Idh/MocA family oxidoreductase [Candidatus Lernaella stagnicola]
MKTLRVAEIGMGWISHVHIQSLQMIPGVQVVCQWGLPGEDGKTFADKYGIPEFMSDYDALLARQDIDALSIGLPNYKHFEYAKKALEAGKHIMLEKPLVLRLAQADELLEIAKKNGLIIGYAEELCYVPKFVHAKKIADAGGLGDVFLVRQHEKHAGAYSPWFFKAETAGGGILMDMGCHAIECCRWVLGKPAVKSVYCQADLFVHKQITELDDHVIMIIEFETGQIAQVESSWTQKGGMISWLEIQGTEGNAHAELLQIGSGVRVYSEKGYSTGDFVEGDTNGWHFPDVEWLFNNGYPQEMADWVGCVRNGGTPVESGEDGRAVLEIMIAAYLSAAEGRKVIFPFDDPDDYDVPVDIWLRSRKK